MPHYTVITAHGLIDLVMAVNETIKDGYEPIGSPIQAIGDYEEKFWCQAVYRRKEKLNAQADS